MARKNGPISDSAREYDPLLSDDGDPPSHPNIGDDAEELEQSTISGSRLKLIATTFDFCTTGIAMAAVGVLIPDIEKFYGINDATTAFIFPAGMVGYLLSTVTVQSITSHFGLRAIAVASPLLCLVSALVLTTGPAFAVLLIAYVFFGYGTGLTDVSWNAWASRMARPNVVQGLLHGSFSIGCILGPGIVVAILEKHRWNSFYLVIALLSCVELIIQGLAFRKDAALKPSPNSPEELYLTESPSLFKNRSIWVCGLFYFIYQGVEASFTDWIVVYLRRVRDTNPSVAGYASSVFWVGMAIGRYTLGLVSEKLGVMIAITAYILIAFTFQVLFGFLQHTVPLLVVLGLNGLMIGPLFPSGIIVLVSRLPQNIRLKAVAFAIGLGQIGGAVAPLGVGFMATHLGIEHLVEVVCGLSILMLVVWIPFARMK